jgi:ornithine--oxo-acid transaminase
MVLPMNSGAEAVETVIKAVRKWGYLTKKIAPNQAEIIVCSENFHGRTITIVGFSTEEAYQHGFGPFTPGFRVVPYGDLEAMRAAINPNTVAVMLEPIQGEAGIIIPPAGYLKGVRELCDAHHVVMVLDEIQTGLGRTGRFFAEEHEGIVSDITLVGKALSGGVYPISAVLSNRETLGVFQPGDHGSTYGGNPLACAVAREALRVLVEERMVENAATLGAHVLARLQAIRSPHVREVRGRGLMIGIELHHSAGGARRYCEALMRRGLLCKDTHGHIIRIAPPLVLQRAEADWMVDQLEAVLAGA